MLPGKTNTKNGPSLDLSLYPLSIAWGRLDACLCHRKTGPCENSVEAFDMWPVCSLSSRKADRRISGVRDPSHITHESRPSAIHGHQRLLNPRNASLIQIKLYDGIGRTLAVCWPMAPENRSAGAERRCECSRLAQLSRACAGTGYNVFADPSRDLGANDLGGRPPRLHRRRLSAARGTPPLACGCEDDLEIRTWPARASSARSWMIDQGSQAYSPSNP